MFWFGILAVVLIVIGVSVVVGLALARGRRSQRVNRQDQINMAKASGAFQHRKSNLP